jgi:hypothetical protein
MEQLKTREPILVYTERLKEYLDSEAIPFEEIAFKDGKKNFPEFIRITEDHWTDEDIFSLGEGFAKYLMQQMSR